MPLCGPSCKLRLARFSAWLKLQDRPSVAIIPLRGPSCKLRLSRFSAKLKFQDGPSVAINIFVHEGKVCLQDRCADMEKVDYPRIISS